MDEKLSFVLAYLRGEWSMSALCEEYGISRKTGYKWVSRYRPTGWRVWWSGPERRAAVLVRWRRRWWKRLSSCAVGVLTGGRASCARC